MKPSGKKMAGFEKQLQKVLETPAGFDFYVAVHDLVEYVNKNSLLNDRKHPAKYVQLQQVYQGIEDVTTPSDKDLGHERHMTILDLNQIRKADVSDSNPLWKRREALRGWVRDLHRVVVEEIKA